MTVEQFPFGTPIHGEHSSADASAGVRLRLTRPRSTTPAAAVTIASDERMVLSNAVSMVGDASAEAETFFDNDALTAALAVNTLTDGGGGVDVLTVAGDVTDMFRIGRLFTIANSTLNDGQYTVVAVSYASVGDLTTISVVTGSWTDETDDGDITADPTNTNGNTIIKTESGSLVVPIIVGWPIGALRFGPYGYSVWAKTPLAEIRSDYVIDGFVQTRVTKSLPISPQAR